MQGTRGLAKASEISHGMATPGPLTRALWSASSWAHYHISRLRAAVEAGDLDGAWLQYGASRSVVLAHIHWEDSVARRAARFQGLVELNRMLDLLRYWHEELVDGLDRIEWTLLRFTDQAILDPGPTKRAVGQLDAEMDEYCACMESGPYVTLENLLSRSTKHDDLSRAASAWPTEMSRAHAQQKESQQRYFAQQMPCTAALC